MLYRSRASAPVHRRSGSFAIRALARAISISGYGISARGAMEIRAVLYRGELLADVVRQARERARAVEVGVVVLELAAEAIRPARDDGNNRRSGRGVGDDEGDSDLLYVRR